MGLFQVFSHLARALLGSIAPGVARRAALLGRGAVPHVPVLSVPLACIHAHLLPSISPAVLHRFGTCESDEMTYRLSLTFPTDIGNGQAQNNRTKNQDLLRCGAALIPATIQYWQKPFEVAPMIQVWRHTACLCSIQSVFYRVWRLWTLPESQMASQSTWQCGTPAHLCNSVLW